MSVRERLGEERSAAVPFMWLALRKHGSQAALARAVDTDGGLIAKLLYGDRKPGRSLSIRLDEIAGVPQKSWDEALDPDLALIPAEWRPADAVVEDPDASQSGEHGAVGPRDGTNG